MAFRKQGIASLLMGACVLMSSFSMTALAAGGEGEAETGSLNIPVTKVVLGREWTAEDKYEFTVSPIGETEGVTMPSKTTLEINEKSVNHTGKFETIVFAKEAKGALFQVTEKDGDTWVLSADAKKDTDGKMSVTYTLGDYDAETEKFTASKGAKSILSITSTDAAEGSVQVNWPAMISMDGRDFTTKDTFGLKFTSDDENAPMPSAENRQLALGEKNLAYLVVGPIVYTEAGTYTYKVSQDVDAATDKDKVTYDAAEYTVTVDVAEKDGALEATTKVTNKAGAEVEMMSFINKAVEDTNPGDGDNTPGDGDNIPGDGDNKPGDGDNNPGDGDNKPGTGDEDKDPEKQDLTGLKALIESAALPATDEWLAGVDAEIAKLKIEDADTLTAVAAVKEARDDLAAMNTLLGKLSSAYADMGGDPTEIKLPDLENKTPEEADLTTLADLIRNPQTPDTEAWLAAIEAEAKTLKLNDAELITMVNDIRTNPEDAEAVARLVNKLTVLYKDLGGTEDLTPVKEIESVKLAIKASLELTGRDWTDDDKFEFEMTAADDATVKAVEDGKVVMNADANVVVTKENVDHTFQMGEIEFKEASGEDGYLFKVTQVGDVDKNGLSGAMSYEIRVIVTEKDGKLEYTCMVAGDVFNPEDASLKFDIAYAAEMVGYTPKATFKLDGRKLVEADTFTMKLKPLNESARNVMGVEKEGDYQLLAFKGYENIDTFVAEFSTLTMKEAGSYAFALSQEIPEDKAKLSGVTYDTSEYFVTVNVTDDMKGHLVSAVRITDKEGKEIGAEGIVFTNSYKKPNANADKKDDTSTTTTTDNKKSNKVTPQTGLRNNALVGVAIGGGAAVIAGAGAGLYFLNKKRKEDEDETDESDDI